jgi:hypothetical protein
MTEMRIYVASPGESFTIHVETFDENNRRYEFPIEIQVQEQDKPRLIGVRVMGVPVLLRGAEFIGHLGGPKRDGDCRHTCPVCHREDDVTILPGRSVGMCHGRSHELPAVWSLA